MIQDKVLNMMKAAKECIIKTMQERGIKKLDLVMTEEEFAKENGLELGSERLEDEYCDYKTYEAPYVVFYDKYNLGNDYAVYSVELEDGPTGPRFKLNCYNGDVGDEWFHDDDLLHLSMIPVYDAMERVLELEEPKEEFFTITRVSRDDLDAVGFDTSEVDDSTMERLASKLGDDYCEQLFWSSLEIIAEYMEIPKKDEEE